VPRGRYAPSPTGWQHLGNARTALVAWTRAGSDGGLVVRVEDLDGPRTVAAALEGNLSELRWLGLDWDEGPDVGGRCAPYRQSLRTSRYQAALARLEADGRTFDCWLSRKDLRELSSAPHGRAPVYGPAEREANVRAAQSKRKSGKSPAVRLRVPDVTEVVVDAFAGSVPIDLAAEMGDTVLRRADGAWAYHLAVVVDDAAMGIVEVVRGDDLLPSAALQAHLHRALGNTPPMWAHLPLLHGPDGRRLAKRDDTATLHDLQQAGVPPERVVGLLAWTLGQLERPAPTSAAELANGFRADAVPRHPVQLASDALAWLYGGPAPAGPPPRAAAVQDARLDRRGDGR